VVGILRKNWKNCQHGIWRKSWTKIKVDLRKMDYFSGINNLNGMDQYKVDIEEKLESK